MDSLVRARVVCQLLGGRSRRTLYSLIQRGEFPPPDRKARKLGEADLWWLSTVKRGVARYAGSNDATWCTEPANIRRAAPAK